MVYLQDFSAPKFEKSMDIENSAMIYLIVKAELIQIIRHTMLTLSLFTLLFTTTAQPYTATEHFLLDCGSSTSTITSNGKWGGDDRSKFVQSNITTASFSSKPSVQDSLVPEIPYSTARIINTSSITYTFPVSQGPKFLRLYFYPATYSNLQPNQSFFSVSSNGYFLLTNFSPFLTASFIGKIRSNAGIVGPSVPNFVKEFIIYVKNTTGFLNLVFTPSPNSYAFINGIEINSMPESLYFGARNFKYVGIYAGPMITDDIALETMYRLNVGGSAISGKDDTGMFREWDQDDDYIYGFSVLFTPVYQSPITYTTETPNYTAPKVVYQTRRAMGKNSDSYNLTWRLPVDSGYYYMLRLHFCNIIPQYLYMGQVVFRIFIQYQIAEDEADLFYWTQGTGYPFFKDYIVFVSTPDGRQRKQDLWLALHPNLYASVGYADGMLNGLEVFKLSMNGNLSSPNPELKDLAAPPVSVVKRNTKKTPPYAVTIGSVMGGITLLYVLVHIVFWQKAQGKPSNSSHASLPSYRCRCFTLTEVKVATKEFNENCVIGKGGFGKVYKGYIDNTTKAVAIKRLDTSSSQGSYEFQTEIVMLSKLHHVHLVSLIGYCCEKGEMVLVYDYMAHGTLQEHLYKTNNPPLSWKTRLNICIGAAKGLHYLHTGGKRQIIHRDVKSTNILLDQKWVAKLSDFGLSKLGSRDPSETHVSTLVKGSIGYMDPEYCRTKQLTDKSDVYSFGVVLFEVLCARPVVNQRLPYEQVSLAKWGKFCHRKGNLNEIVDPKLNGEITPGCLRKFGEVASSCLHEYGSERPAMEDVVYGLELALKLQEDAEKPADEVVPENQEIQIMIPEESTTMDGNVLGNKGM